MWPDDYSDKHNSTLEQAERQDEIDRLGPDAVRRDPAAGNQVVADKAADDGEDFRGYRDRGNNGAKRALYLERLVIDHFCGGDVARFDREAGLDLDA